MTHITQCVSTTRQWAREHASEDTSWSVERRRKLTHSEFDARLRGPDWRLLDLQLRQHAGHACGGVEQVHCHVLLGPDGQLSVLTQPLLGPKGALQLERENRTLTAWKENWLANYKQITSRPNLSLSSSWRYWNVSTIEENHKILQKCKWLSASSLVKVWLLLIRRKK